MSDCFSIKHSKYISSFFALVLAFLPLSFPFVRCHRHAVIVNEGYCEGDFVWRHLPVWQAIIPLSALNDNEGLTRFTQLAWHRALVTWPRLCGAVQKLNFHRLPHTRANNKRVANQREYAVYCSDPDLIFLCHPATGDGGS